MLNGNWPCTWTALSDPNPWNLEGFLDRGHVDSFSNVWTLCWARIEEVRTPLTFTLFICRYLVLFLLHLGRPSLLTHVYRGHRQGHAAAKIKILPIPQIFRSSVRLVTCTLWLLAPRSKQDEYLLLFLLNFTLFQSWDYFWEFEWLEFCISCLFCRTAVMAQQEWQLIHHDK